MEEEEEIEKSTVAEDFSVAARAILDSIELGILKLWTIKKTTNNKSKTIEVEAEERSMKRVGKANRVIFIEDPSDQSKAKIKIGFTSADREYEIEKLVPSSSADRTGLFFSKEGAEAAYRKELKERLEEDLAERMKSVTELKSLISSLK